MFLTMYNYLTTVCVIVSKYLNLGSVHGRNTLERISVLELFNNTVTLLLRECRFYYALGLSFIMILLGIHVIPF